jgi:hypothetical protein
MCAFDLYVQRLAADAALLMDMTVGEPELDPALAAQYGETTLRHGLPALRRLLAALYADMGAHPSEYAIPPVPDAKVWDAASRRRVRGPFEAPLRALYALGLTSEWVARRGARRLVTDEAALAAEATALGVRDLGAALALLDRVGLQATSTRGAVTLACTPDASALAALRAFSRVCHLWERGKLASRRLPDVFVMAEFRILARAGCRAALPRLTLDEVLPFAPAGRRADLQALARHAATLGYRPQVRPGNTLDGEWHTEFVGGKARRGLLGVTICRGRVDLRLICSDSAPLAPHIAACPASLRDELIEGSCGRCGGSGCGQEVTVIADGEERHICRFGNLRISTWDAEGLETFRGLLTVQAERYAQT